MRWFCEVAKRLVVSVLITTLVGTVYVLLYNKQLDSILVSKSRHSNKHVTNYWTRITKRSVDQRTEFSGFEDSCNLPNPSPDDLLLLKGRTLKHKTDVERNHNIVCTVNFTCVLENVHVLVECSSRACSSISVTFKETNVTRSGLNMQMLAELVEVMNELGVGEINDKLLISCEDRAVEDNQINLILGLEYFGNRYCTETSSRVDINVFFFRFLSRQSLIEKMTSLMATINDNEEIDVIDFPKYQSTEWKFTKSMSLFLQGSDAFNVSERSLLTLARELGFDVKLLDTSIEKGPVHEEFVKLISKQLNETGDNSNSVVHNSNSVIHNSNSVVHNSRGECCSSVFDEEFDIKTKLEYLKECFVKQTPHETKKPLFRLVLINYIDYSSEHVFIDNVLSEIITLLSKQQNSITILFSDVGDPTFATLASSLFLQTEPSNPFLFFFIPHNVRNLIPDERLRIAERNTGHVINLRDVHETITDVIYFMSGSSEDNVSRSRRKGSYGIGRSLFMVRDVSLSCEYLKITPPGLCICEDRFALYPNDTIQVAFAETALGLIKNRLLDYVSVQLGHSATYLSPLIRGKSFTKVRVRNHNNAQQRMMDITYIDNTGFIGTLFNISVTFDPEEKTCTVGVSETKHIDNTFIETHFSTVTHHVSRLYVPRQLTSSSESHRFSNQHFGVSPREIILHENCLVLLKFDFVDSATFEIGNVCSDRKYNFSFDSNLLDAVSLVALPLSLSLKPGDVRFLTTLVKSSYLVNHGLFHYETDFDVVYL